LRPEDTGGVFVGYGEDSDAALGAAGAADEMVATAAVGVGYGGVYDLDEGFAQRTSKGMTRKFK
jgi:hypothetical protein